MLGNLIVIKYEVAYSHMISVQNLVFELGGHKNANLC